MKDFKLGDKVDFGGMVGYIVAIEIDVFEPHEIPYQKESPIYTVRCFDDWYRNGYFDFKCFNYDLKRVQEEVESDED